MSVRQISSVLHWPVRLEKMISNKVKIRKNNGITWKGSPRIETKLAV